MKNRFAAIFLLIAMLSAVIPTQIFASRVNASSEDAIAFMNTMQFITESETAEDKLDTKISRMQFVSYLARVLGINETSTSDKDYFYDIPTDHWGKFSVNSLVEMGIITVGENRLFRPDDILTKQEAAVIAAFSLGRGQEAVLRGGYPTGYMTIATEEKLFDGINGQELTVEGAAVFLYNLINANVMQPALPGEPGTLAKNDNTILSEYHDIYYQEGYVNAVWGASVDEKVANNSNEVIIDGEQYVSQTWQYDYLGQNIKFYYKEIEDDQKEIIYVFADADEKNKVRYITSDNYEGYENGRIVYFDENDSRKSVQVYSGATVIRNGKNVSDNLTTALAPFYGTMRVINSGKYSGYDVIIIEDYVSMAVGSVSTESRSVYDKYDYTRYIDLSETADSRIIYLDAMDDEVDFSSITVNAVISVAQSSDKTFALVKINSANVTGVIDKVSEDAVEDTIIEIDGEEYIVEKSFYEKYKTIFVRGAQGNFKSDILGKIVYYSLDISSDMQYTFLIDGQLKSELNGKDLGDERVIFKIFTEEGVLQKVALAEKVRIDGVSFSNHERILENFEVEGVFKPTTVRVKYDNNNNIKTIDTASKGPDEGRYSLTLRNATNKTPAKYNSGLVGINLYAPITTKTMIVPEEGKENDVDDKAYSIGTFYDVPNEDAVRIDLYQMDSESMKTDLVVYHKPVKPSLDNAEGNWEPYYVVEKVTQELNNDEEPAICFTLDKSGVNEKFIVANDYQSQANSIAQTTSTGLALSHMNPTSIGKGDIIRIATDYKKEIVDIQLIFDYSVAQSNPKDQFFNNAVHKKWEISAASLPGSFRYDVTNSYGYVSHVDGKYFQWGFLKPGDVNQVYCTDISSATKFYVFDPDEEDSLQPGTVGDLVGYYQNSNNYSRIMTNTQGGRIQQCIIYK